MGALVHLSAADGHRFTAYRADPVGAPKAGVVLLHEIYGVNTHIRGLADALADEGYAVRVPALFDRAEKGVELDYSAAGAEHGCFLRDQIGWDAPLLDVAGAMETLKGFGRIAVVGESYGATLAWRAAAKLPLAAAVCGSPGHLGEFLAEAPICPVLIHFGARDPATPLDVRDRARTIAAVTAFDYDAGHAFTCPHREGFDSLATRTAETRTMDFLKRHLQS